MKFEVKSKPEFLVDQFGNIYWRKTGTRLSPYVDKDGYLRVTYRIKGKNYHIAVHRAVAEVFVVNQKPDKYNQVNHKDSNRQNNSIDNLEWVSARINTAHALLKDRFKNRVGLNHPQTVLDEDSVKEICKLLSEGISVAEVSKITSQPKHRIYNIKSGKCWRRISESFGIKLPTNRCTVGIDFLKEEKESLAITPEEYKRDYGVID